MEARHHSGWVDTSNLSRLLAFGFAVELGCVRGVFLVGERKVAKGAIAFPLTTRASVTSKGAAFKIVSQTDAAKFC